MMKQMEDMGIGHGTIKPYDEAVAKTGGVVRSDRFWIVLHLNWKYKGKWENNGEKNSDKWDACLVEDMTAAASAYRNNPPGMPNLSSIVVAPNHDIISVVGLYLGTVDWKRERYDGRFYHNEAGLLHLPDERTDSPSVWLNSAPVQGSDLFEVQVTPPVHNLPYRVPKDEEDNNVIVGGKTFTFSNLSYSQLSKGRIRKKIEENYGDGSYVQGTAVISLGCDPFVGLKQGVDWRLDIIPRLENGGQSNGTCQSAKGGGNEVVIHKPFWDNSSVSRRNTLGVHEVYHISQRESGQASGVKTPWDKFLIEYEAFKVEADYINDCVDVFALSAEESKWVDEQRGLIYNEDGTPRPLYDVYVDLVTKHGYRFVDD